MTTMLHVTLVPHPESGQECDACDDRTTPSAVRVATDTALLYLCEPHAQVLLGLLKETLDG